MYLIRLVQVLFYICHERSEHVYVIKTAVATGRISVTNESPLRRDVRCRSIAARRKSIRLLFSERFFTRIFSSLIGNVTADRPAIYCRSGRENSDFRPVRGVSVQTLKKNPVDSLGHGSRECAAIRPRGVRVRSEIEMSAADALILSARRP